MKKNLLKKESSRNSSQDSLLPALRPTMLLVLGMHRSGTSVTARLLECLGAKNSDNLVRGTANNPQGFFEDNDVYLFNDLKLLPRLGRAWHSTSEVDWSNLSDMDRSKYALQALEIVKQNYSLSNTLSVLKEPRLGILVPFWLAVLQHAGFNTKIVCAVRDPVSVIRSLNKAEGLSLPHAGMVFINYWLSILKYCKNLEVAFFQYDEIFLNPAKSLRDVATKLSLPLPKDFEERVDHFSSSFFDKNLRHNKFDTKDLVLESDLPPLAIELYKSLLSAAQAQNIKKTIKFAEAARVSTEALQSIFLEFDRLTSQVHSTNARVHELQTALDAERAAGNSVHLSGLVNERDERIAGLEGVVSELQSESSTLSSDNTSLATSNSLLATERDALSTDLQETFEELAKLAKLQLSTEDERNALQAKVSELRAERDELATRHQQLATERDALSTDLSQRFHEIALLGKRLLEVEAESYRRVAALQALMDAMQARITWKLGAPARLVWDKARNTALKIYRLPTAWRIVRLHRSSGVFNHEWYYRQNPDVKATTARPFLHFAFHGVFEGRTPNPSYNESAYLRHTPSAQSSSMKPLLHYTLKGWKGKSS